MPGAGDRMPFFEVTTTDGGRAAYRDHWQRRPVVLVIAARDRGWQPFLVELEARRAAIVGHGAALVITEDEVEGVSPGLVIADRWGEIQHVAAVPDAGPGAAGAAVSLPDPAGIVAWVEFVQHQCPECEGESR